MEEKRAVEETEAEGKKNSAKKMRRQADGGLLQDPRFKDLFENPDFQIDKNADEFRLLHPAVSRLDKVREKRIQKQLAEQPAKVRR